MRKWPELCYPSDADEGTKTPGLCRMFQGCISFSQNDISALAEGQQGIFTIKTENGRVENIFRY